MSDTHLVQASAIVENAHVGPGLVPFVKSFFDQPTNTVSYVVHDPATHKAAVIDSVLDFDPAAGRTSFASADTIIAYVKSENLKVTWLLETHAHADHLSAAPYLKDKLGGTLAIGREIIHVQNVFGKIFNEGTEFARDGSEFDRLFEDGDRFQIGGLEAMALHLPGHTLADLAYVIGDAVFTGDTLFMPDYGTARADFPGGDSRQLFRSIRRLMELPERTRLFHCHDYKAAGRDSFAWETTVGAQRASNVHVHEGVTEDDFVTMRDARDATLSMPRLILPSIQVNMRGGHLPEQESNGTRYLKLPLDVL
ncbi:MBL fold metallo-hydrolase [Sphingomonas sp. UV9]|uniref:MBL fold metallo-hydrolase n=1 Tax=Sphingomonas sp. UV9 TaxID=1851410 RepID=UPI000FFB944F|nr:MBL fold metallo-hydrolase [Sphingomonas sp. UV9]RXD07308.1 MBL fold metallo-hydrolase [Sphingomonas sp. UV9]